MILLNFYKRNTCFGKDKNGLNRSRYIINNFVNFYLNIYYIKDLFYL